MSVVVDIHAILWWLADDELSDETAATVADPDNLVVASAASLWEIEIKRRLGKLRAPDTLVHVIAESGFEPLDVTHAHAASAGRLPFHHRDPFDRMLVAQAQIEDLTIVSRDRSFEQYDVLLLLC